ncbi:unnamed protein product [Polarella glacialis]|uniref:Uncharacterized protein n=1 Tax=Polarella glacialis TaxID=89957 RepID=A0A813LP46_POLGL|nr:unnamed protein product [Polarella glacialis]
MARFLLAHVGIFVILSTGSGANLPDQTETCRDSFDEAGLLQVHANLSNKTVDSMGDKKADSMGDKKADAMGDKEADAMGDEEADAMDDEMSDASYFPCDARRRWGQCYGRRRRG